jgi:hypothetical protein
MYKIETTSAQMYNENIQKYIIPFKVSKKCQNAVQFLHFTDSIIQDLRVRAKRKNYKKLVL